jgi:hypothetical protein
MKEQLLSPLKMLGDMDEYSIPCQGNIFPHHKNYLHGKRFIQNIL